MLENINNQPLPRQQVIKSVILRGPISLQMLTVQ